jgi:hypothetical protein
VVILCTTRFNIYKIYTYVLPNEYIYVVCMDLKTNSDYFSRSVSITETVRAVSLNVTPVNLSLRWLIQFVSKFYYKLITGNDVSLGKCCGKSITSGHNRVLPHPSPFVI